MKTAKNNYTFIHENRVNYDTDIRYIIVSNDGVYKKLVRHKDNKTFSLEPFEGSDIQHYFRTIDPFLNAPDHKDQHKHS